MSDERITLATLPTATKQQVFDQVARHLLAQGRQSVRESSGYACAYRGDGGLMCAAGCLIADGEYQSTMEGKSWTGIGQRFGVERTKHDRLISDLQMLHDDYAPYNWLNGLHRIALNYGLNTIALYRLGASA